MDILQGDGLWSSDHWVPRASNDDRPLIADDRDGGRGPLARREAIPGELRLARICNRIIMAIVAAPVLIGVVVLFRRLF